MKIELCGEDRLRITLNQADLEQLSISFEELDYVHGAVYDLLLEVGNQ